MSYTLRRMQLPENKHLRVIRSEELPSFWSEARLPTPIEQADNFIVWVGDNQETPSAWAEATASIVAATIGIALSSGGDSQGWGWLHSQLEPKGLYRLIDGAGGKVRLQLTMEGWERYEHLKEQRVESRTAFMALKFNDASLDQAVQECFKPAVARTGFELRTLTDQQAAGLIDDKIRAALLSARFVVADLTHGSHGAYWEAGFAEGRGIPVIYTCEIGAWEQSRTHFDTNHMLTILWDPSDLKKAEDAMAATIRATLRGEANQIDQ
ncbi:hypothetical protein IVB18_34610 [Bradyrhizobium sp. 186]|uniref:hypothetical protein n=1 Tax=Bradyrhizobium sp. 186 TaxID=2782654 RepID=UPI00200102B3|nr:hypothetical protein [Bradyrhizobium sp. 186]UPK33321.1 hypothetical protein IVB18_34610 [Bradyrhizobium sp. 186]